MSGQSYQEVSKVMEKDIEQLKEMGIKSLDNLDVQNYFFKKKQNNPEKYERLNFDTNGHEPYSETVSNIVSDFLTSGILYTRYYLIK